MIDYASMNAATQRSKVRVFLADDHCVVRKGLIAMLTEEPDMEVVGESETGLGASEGYRLHRPDVLLLEPRLLMPDGSDVVTAIRNEFPAAIILVLTTFDGDDDIYRAFRAGAKGYLLKNATFDQIVRAVRDLHQGKTCVPAAVAAKLAMRAESPNLTQRELDVLELLVSGQANREIAKSLFVSEETVKTHVKNLLAKLGAEDRTHAVTVALKRGLVRLK